MRQRISWGLLRYSALMGGHEDGQVYIARTSQRSIQDVARMRSAGRALDKAEPLITEDTDLSAPWQKTGVSSAFTPADDCINCICYSLITVLTYGSAAAL